MKRSAAYTVFSVPGWGSALVEAMLALCSAPVQIEDVTGFDRPGAARDRLLQVNPLIQVPALVLPEGTFMTDLHVRGLSRALGQRGRDIS